MTAEIIAFGSEYDNIIFFPFIYNNNNIKLYLQDHTYIQYCKSYLYFKNKN